MPSPFPGMDPFLENQEWTDFHSTLITVFREHLAPQLGERYVARVERRIYVEQVERRKSYLVIRDRRSHEVVTVIEVLSPTNKAPGSDGRFP